MGFSLIAGLACAHHFTELHGIWSHSPSILHKATAPEKGSFVLQIPVSRSDIDNLTLFPATLVALSFVTTNKVFKSMASLWSVDSHLL
jgi:hypothetical protein